MLKKLRNNIGMIILVVVFGLILLGATYVNVGPTTEFEGDVGVPSGSGYYIGDMKLDIDDFVGGAWHSTHLEDQLFFGELGGINEVLTLLSTTTISFAVDADTALYTVPTGKRCILYSAIVVAAGDAGATITISIGANGSETDFIPANTLSNLDAQYDAVILQPIPNTTPLKTKSYATATVIEARVANQSGVAGNTIYLFGIIY